MWAQENEKSDLFEKNSKHDKRSATSSVSKRCLCLLKTTFIFIFIVNYFNLTITICSNTLLGIKFHVIWSKCVWSVYKWKRVKMRVIQLHSMQSNHSCWKSKWILATYVSCMCNSSLEIRIAGTSVKLPERIICVWPYDLFLMI